MIHWLKWAATFLGGAAFGAVAFIVVMNYLDYRAWYRTPKGRP